MINQQSGITSSSSDDKQQSIKQPSSKEQKEIEIILNLGQHLEDCEFDLFWKEYNLNKKIFEQFKMSLISFEKEIRRYICLMIQSVYQNINILFLTQLLQLKNDKELEKCINEINIGWKINNEKSIIQIPKTNENSDEVQRTTQFVSTDSMNQILSTFSNF